MRKYSFVMCLIVLSLTLPAYAQTGDTSLGVTGTYLIMESSGNKRLWTFTQDGNILGTSSVQQKFNFSNQQGTYEVSGDREVTAVIFNFGFDGDGNLTNSSRVEATLNFDEEYRTFDGSFTLRKYEDTEDPMNPESDAGEPITDTFSGQRITIE